MSDGRNRLRLGKLGKRPVEKHGTKPRQPWRKLDIVRDADTHQIVAAPPTTNGVNYGSPSGRWGRIGNAAPGCRTGVVQRIDHLRAAAAGGGNARGRGATWFGRERAGRDGRKRHKGNYFRCGHDIDSL